MSNEHASRLSDRELEAEVKRLASCERQATVGLILRLAEFDARRLYLGAGFSSLFTFCCGVLRLSESEAYNRIEAARAVRKWPGIADLLRSGSLNLTTVRLLAAHLTDQNHGALLRQASGKSKREVEELLAALFPREAVPDSVRKVAPPRVEWGAAGAWHGASSAGVRTMAAAPHEGVALGCCAVGPAALEMGTAPAKAPGTVSGETSPQQPDAHSAQALSAARPHPTITPLSAELYHFRFTASAATREKLRQAQDLLRHAVPNGDIGEIVDRALTALLDDLARKKLGAARRPRAARPPQVSRVRRQTRPIPAAVKRAVWARDGGRCAFRGKGGRRCDERGFLEWHHADPHGIGGEATNANIELRCRAHNAYEAELFFGRDYCEERRTRSGTSSFSDAGATASAPASSGQ